MAHSSFIKPPAQPWTLPLTQSMPYPDGLHIPPEDPAGAPRPTTPTGTVLDVLLAPHRTLTLRARAVDRPEDPELQALIVDMLATLQHHEALGLAAPQVGVSLRVIVARGKASDTPLVLINPRIVTSHGAVRGEEGCLSFPSKSLMIRRPAIVTVAALDASGSPINFTVEGMIARVIQHENDHLDGILFTQRRS